MIQVLPIPRQLPRGVIWSIYTVTWLGFIVAVIVIMLLYYGQEKPTVKTENKNLTRESQSQQEKDTREDVLPPHQKYMPNTSWLEGSDTEIRYIDEFGKPRLMNVLLLDSLETSEQRVMDLERIPWVGNDDEDVTGMLLSDWQEITLGRVGVICNCSKVQGSWLCVWILSETPAYISNTHKRQLQRKLTKPSSSSSSNDIDSASQCGSTALRSHKPGPNSSSPSSLLVEDETLTCNTINVRTTTQIHISKANELTRWRRDDEEWKEPSFYNDKVYVTKMILEIDGTPMYFVAAPISNVSLRFVYGGKPSRCLTCPEGVASRLECLSSDAQLSTNARYYILYCRGPEVPWTAVISMERNEFVYRLNNQERQREWYASRPRPVTRELEVKLDKQYSAKVRLHLPYDLRDKPRRNDEKCNEMLSLILRIGDEQQSQMVNAEFDFSLTNYLTTIKGYAVVYADVRASLFQSFDFRNLRYRRRELMQMSDYAKVVAHITTNFECIEDKIVGVFGENYGGHVALNLVADNYEKRNTKDDGKFRCCVAVNPLARWQDYVYPFSAEHSMGVTGALRKKMFERRYMRQLVSRLQSKNFALHTSNPTSPQDLYYTKTLLKVLNRHAVKFDHQHYEDESARMCDSRLKSYESASDFFDRCFSREIDNAD